MTKFKELVDKVIVLSNRPDVREEIKIAIRDATLAIHHLDFFWRDIRTGLVNASGTVNRLEVPLSNFARLRSMKSVAPYKESCCLEPLKPNASIDYCKCNSNWWRLSGSNLVISSNQRTNQFEISYYSNPIVAPDELYSSWAADLYPEIVVNWALMLLFEALRDSSIADRYRVKVGSREPPRGHIAIILGEQLEQEVRSY